MSAGSKGPHMVWPVTGLLLLLSLGCAGIGPKPIPPRVSLVDIEVKEAKALETVYLLLVRVINPNDLELAITGMHCDLEINGTRLASGVTDTKRTIPPFGTAVVPIQVYSSVVEMLYSLLSLQNREKVQYVIKGRLRIQGGTLMPSVIPFQVSGEFSLRGLRNP
ncbi:MAG: LEA type 2 family protein [Deltaproteobacteria bacterium]|nr:LEA type 2 family protein [Deltaproteobacteria bacterium]MBW2304404.1 LEA type 2 family protein [Deltaproteobacteria bacterium]